MHHLSRVLIAAFAGLLSGFLLGWITVGVALTQAGRGGHADLGILFLSATATALLCAAAAGIAASHWSRRREIRALLLRSFPGLHPHLRLILEVELAAGNSIVEAWSGFGDGVLLSEPFKRRHSVQPGVIEYNHLDDPHYWQAEYRVLRSSQFIACRF